MKQSKALGDVLEGSGGMAAENKDESCCTSVSGEVACCCRVESVISVDERGQIVLPKEIRDKAGIRAGDKLTVVSLEKDGEVYCISLIKADDLAGLIKTMLGSVIKKVLQD
jgi:AbrB family looped-hinge helix DNA binding protein